MSSHERSQNLFYWNDSFQSTQRLGSIAIIVFFCLPEKDEEKDKIFRKQTK
jgi:hypothetical protein